MKKLTALLLLSLSLLVLAACHQHSYDLDYYVYDQAHHWHAPTCQHQDALKDKGEHSLDENGICTVCGYDGYPYVMELDYYGTHYRLSGVKQNLSGEITLPEAYKGLPVKEIDMWGFSANGDVGSVNGVTKVVIPDCYEEIGFNAFDKMPSLKTVIIGNGVKKILSGAFEDCKNLETVVFGNSVEAIYAEAFQHCESLKDVVLPNSLKEITYRAFAYCNSISSIVIPEGVTTMVEDAFYNNESLTDVYCEAEAQPATWEIGWLGNCSHYCANKNVKVTFGYSKDDPSKQTTITYGVNFDDVRSWCEPVLKDGFSYLNEAGDEVTFYLKPIEGRGDIAMYLNGVRLGVGKTVEGVYEGETITLYEYTFTMPNETASVSFQVEDGQPQP